MPSATISGPTDICRRGPMRSASGRRAGRAGQHDQRDRQRGGARLERRVAQHLLQLHDQQEEHPAERAVDDDRHQVGGPELRRGEQLGRHHRRRPPPLDHHPGHGGRRPHDQGHDDARRAEPLLAGGDQAPAQAAERHRHEQRAEAVDRAGHLGVTRLGHVPGRDSDHDHGERDVDEEDRPPRPGVDQPPAHERPDGRRHAREARPGADGPGSVLPAEAGLEDGEAAGRQQRPAHALGQPRDHQLGGAGGERAADRADREDDDAQLVDAAAAVAVAQRAAQQDQRRQHQQVAVDHPLEAGDRGVEVLPDVGEGDVDDRAVEERHARPGDGGQQHPPALRRVEGQRVGRGRRNGFRSGSLIVEGPRAKAGPPAQPAPSHRPRRWHRGGGGGHRAQPASPDVKRSSTRRATAPAHRLTGEPSGASTCT